MVKRGQGAFFQKGGIPGRGIGLGGLSVGIEEWACVNRVCAESSRGSNYQFRDYISLGFRGEGFSWHLRARLRNGDGMVSLEDG